eukprot:602865-Hanusia_phi.AAC.1
MSIDIAWDETDAGYQPPARVVLQAARASGPGLIKEARGRRGSASMRGEGVVGACMYVQENKGRVL